MPIIAVVDLFIGSIDPSHKSHTALARYPTVHHFVTDMCTFLLQNGALWDMEQVHSGICELGHIDLIHKSQNALINCLGPQRRNKPVPQIPQCTSTLSHYAPLCNKCAHVCAFLLKSGALWDLYLMHCEICEMGLYIYTHILWKQRRWFAVIGVSVNGMPSM